MPSYSIALLFHCTADNEHMLETIQAFREQTSFASVYLYTGELEQERRLALQKLDVIIRRDDSDNRFRVARRMFTEVEADIYVYVGDTHYPPQVVSTLIHQLIESRLDMTAAVTPRAGSRLSQDYRTMCRGLFGRNLISPLSDYRVFSRRFVKSFAGFERGFPIELEWSMHALELDIPYMEYELLPEGQTSENRFNNYHFNSRQALSRFILNLHSRPLKWFGAITGFFGTLTLVYLILFIASYSGYNLYGIPDVIFADLTALIGLIGMVSALAGLILHSQSHHQRELKRLQFQTHRTL